MPNGFSRWGILATTTARALQPPALQLSSGHEPTQFLRPVLLARLSRLLPQLFGRRQPDLSAIHKEIEKRHDESVLRLQAVDSPAFDCREHRGMDEGCDLAMHMLHDAGFGEGHENSYRRSAGIFATLDAGAPRTLGIYFMYDVKQVDPAEWSSPPFEAAIIEKPGLGKAVIGRGAVNQKGPEASFWRRCTRFAAPAENSRESCIRGGRRRRNRFTALSADRASYRVLTCAAKMFGRLHTSAEQDLDGKVTNDAWRQGRHRTRTGLERRKVGTRSTQGCPLQPEGDD